MAMRSLFLTLKYNFATFTQTVFESNRSVVTLVKDIVIGAGGLGSIPGKIILGTLANGSPPLRRFSIAQALSRGDGPRHSLHALDVKPAIIMKI